MNEIRIFQDVVIEFLYIQPFDRKRSWTDLWNKKNNNPSEHYRWSPLCGGDHN